MPSDAFHTHFWHFVSLTIVFKDTYFYLSRKILPIIFTLIMLYIVILKTIILCKNMKQQCVQGYMNNNCLCFVFRLEIYRQVTLLYRKRCKYFQPMSTQKNYWAHWKRTSTPCKLYQNIYKRIYKIRGLSSHCIYLYFAFTPVHIHSHVSSQIYCWKLLLLFFPFFLSLKSKQHFFLEIYDKNGNHDKSLWKYAIGKNCIIYIFSQVTNYKTNSISEALLIQVYHYNIFIYKKLSSGWEHTTHAVTGSLPEANLNKIPITSSYSLKDFQ